MKDPKKHLRILGYIHMIIGLLYAIPTLLFLIGMPFGALSILSEVIEGGSIFRSSDWNYFVLFTIFAGISLFNILFGMALTNYKAWATKTVGYIIGILKLFSFPIGTAIGVYLIWTLIEFNKSIRQT